MIGRIASPKSTTNQISASTHRFGRKMPLPDEAAMKDFVRFSKTFILTHFTPPTAADVPTFDEWLENSSYPPGRKKALRKVREEFKLDHKIYESQSFGKHEAYMEDKHMRAINSPSDLSKVILGPLIYASDKATFKTKWFVKGSDPRDWPERLVELFGDRAVMETDFSSFEAHHRAAFAEIIHFWLTYMTGHLSTELQKCLIERLVLGTNVAVFKYITVAIKQRLMSGALWTSSANGVLNLLIMAFLNARSVSDAEPEELARNIDAYFRGLVEGDDGICEKRGVKVELIRKLGLDLKFEEHDNFGHANFCGITCALDSRVILTDPIAVLRKFFVLPPKYMEADSSVQAELMRSKAISYLYLYHDCPIIGWLAYRVCELTRGRGVICLEKHAHEKWILRNCDLTSGKPWLVPPRVSMSARQHMEAVFGVTVSKQLELEAQIRTSGPVFRLDLWEFLTTSDLDFAEAHLVYDPSDRLLPTPEVNSYVASVKMKGFGKPFRPKAQQVPGD